MAFQTPITIHAALSRIRDREYVLPAIQREFVWDTDQICKLFDSLMRGYPIGSFLFWKVTPERAKDFNFYRFLKDYHEKDGRHCPPADLPPGQAVTAILDGQQRLTSLNVGLRGTHAERKRYGHKKDPNAYPKRRLYLNLAADAPDDSEVGLRYAFRFLPDDEADILNAVARDKAGGGPPAASWFPVADAFDLEDSGPALYVRITDAGLAGDKDAFDRLYQLRRLVHERPVISFYEEDSQDLDKVLNIFVRVNSGGEPLSYSDLLLSIATAGWRELDARQAVHDLVDEVNGVGRGFRFSKDLALKTGLVLTDRKSVTFKVDSFTAENVGALEAGWDKVGDALRTAAALLDSFGFSDATLPAASAVIPIADYIHHRGLGPDYPFSVKYKEDRGKLRSWLLRSIFKPGGVWGSGLDQMLLALRAAVREHGAGGFPLAAFEDAMARRGKSLQFTEEELDELLGMKIGNSKTFALLATLFDHFDTAHKFHVDHVVPKAKLTRPRLRNAGLPPEDVEEIFARRDRLPNLQLLTPSENQSKGERMPADWLADYKPGADERGHYLNLNAMGDLPAEIGQFLAFYGDRRTQLLNRLRERLDVRPAGDG